jgi:putative membrane protein
MYYDIITALHILSVISWMVGLLYLPRLFVYHADSGIGTVRAETFKVMERRLLKAIMTPAMIASFIFRHLVDCAQSWACL